MKRMLLVIGLVVFMLWSPQVLPAQTIQVEVNGTPVACPAASCDLTFNLAAATLPAGTPFTITSTPGKQAMVVADDQVATGIDVLKMVDSLITANPGGVSNNTIVFKRVFNVDPQTPPGSTNVANFDRQATGSFIKSGGTLAPVTAKVTVNALVAGEVIISSSTKTVVCSPLGCGAILLPKGPLSYFDPDHPLIGAHEVRGEMTALKLPSTGDQLRIDEFRIISSSGGAGGNKERARGGLGVTDGCSCYVKPKVPKGVTGKPVPNR